MRINLAAFCEPVNLSDDTQWRSEEQKDKKKPHPKTDDTEEVVLLYFLLPNYTKKRLTVFFCFFKIMQFEQVGTRQECPLTPVWNIPQINRIIVKESLLIGNQKGVLGWLNHSLFSFS